MQHTRLLFAAVVTLAPGLAFAQGFTRATDFHTLDSGPASHAIPWANPASEGPLRVLAIAPYSTMGDVAQLRNHLEMDLETVALWSRAHIGFDPLIPQPDLPEAARDAVIERLERGLRRKKLDLIIIADADPALFPATIQQEIIQQVESGTGLLLTTHGMDTTTPFYGWLNALPQAAPMPDLLAGVGPLGIDRALESALVTCRNSSAGRVVVLAFPHEPSVNHSLITLPVNPYNMREGYLDNAFSLLAGAARWAARGQSPIQITQIVDVSPQGPDDEEIPPGYPPEFIEAIRKNALAQPLRPFVVHLKEPAPRNYDVWHRLRHLGASVPDILRSAENAPLRKGASFYPLDVIAAPGSYLIDVWLKDRRGTVAWYSQRITIPGWPTLANITLSRADGPAVWLQPNDYVDISAEVDPGPLTTRRQEGTIYARAVDGHGRQLARASAIVGSEGGPVSLRLELADLVAPLVMIEVFAVPASLAGESAFVDQAARELFHLPVRQPEPALQPRLGITTATRPDHGTYRQLEILRDQFGASILHTPLSVDALLAAGRLGYQRLSQVTGEFSPPQGAALTRVPCLSSAGHQSRLRQHIESGILQSYAGGPPLYSLGAGSALTHSDADVCHGPDCLARFRQRLQAQYTSLEALNQAWVAEFVSWDTVEPLPLEHCRKNGHYLPWLDFRASMSEVFATGLAEGAAKARQVDPRARAGFLPDPRPVAPQSGIRWDAVSAAMDFVVVPNEPGAIRRLQSFHGQHPWSGITVDSRHFRENPERARWFAWHAALEQVPAIWLDRPFEDPATRLVGPTGSPTPSFGAFGQAWSEIGRGLGALLLRAAPYRNGIAFLDTPESDWLGYIERETAAYTEDWFAESLHQAGFAPVVRSVNPHMGKGLDDLNTVILADTRVLTHPQREALLEFHRDGGLIIASRRPNTLDPPAEMGGAGALPFLHAVLPTEAAPDLWSNRPVWARQISTGASGAEQLEALIVQAGNEPMPGARISDRQRGQLRRYHFSYGDATITAFLPDRSVARPLKRATYLVPDEHYAYDLRASEPLPAKSRIQWSPAPGEPKIIASLPYRVRELTLDTPPDAVSGERLPVNIIMKTDGKNPGPHLFSLRVIGPDGNDVAYYHQLLEGTEGRAQTFLPLAQNEGPVRYTLIATDLLTGVTVQRYLTVHQGT